jgi:hypothetical protein
MVLDRFNWLIVIQVFKKSHLMRNSKVHQSEHKTQQLGSHFNTIHNFTVCSSE